MKVGDYLPTHQPALYQTMVNALTTDRLSHAYLLVGEAGTPLLPIAVYLAKSLVCDHPHPLACESCLSCLRIDDGNYADFMLFDGSQSTIKKDDVQSVEFNFEKTAIEAKGRMIYVLHLVENMTPEAVNSLLKFLEEPGKDIYAFLTTENESKVLPTIVSRTQTLRLKLADRQIVIQEAVALGIAAEDAEMLSYFFNDGASIAERSTDEDYQEAKEALKDLLVALAKDPKEAVFVSQTKVIPLLKSKEAARFYLDMLAQVIRDLISVSFGGRVILTNYGSIVNGLKGKIVSPEKVLVDVMTARGQLDLNVSVPLLLDHVIYTIVKGEL